MSPQVPLSNSVAPFPKRCFGVARPGFEPGQTEPKSVVLPLHYRAPPEGEVIYRMALMTGKVQSPMRLGISHEQSLSRFFPWSYGEPQPASCSMEDCAGARLGGLNAGCGTPGGRCPIPRRRSLAWPWSGGSSAQAVTETRRATVLTDRVMAAGASHCVTARLRAFEAA